MVIKHSTLDPYKYKGRASAVYAGVYQLKSAIQRSVISLLILNRISEEVMSHIKVQLYRVRIGRSLSAELRSACTETALKGRMW